MTATQETPATPMARSLPGPPNGFAKVSGQTPFTADLQLPGLLYAAVVRSPHPHARIRALRTAAAAALPGVHAVLTGTDIPYGTYGRVVCDIPALATGEVRYIGERVAAVAAESRAIAEAAVALVEVDYEPLPAVTDLATALSPAAPAVHAKPWQYRHAVVTPADHPNLQCRRMWTGGGDIAIALTRSHRVFEHTFQSPARHQGYLEPHVCIARVTAAGDVEIWAPNKSPYRLQQQMADWLGTAPERVQVHPVPIGGDFGGKGSPMDVPLCIALAQRTGRPVQLRLRYAEDLIAGNPRHPGRITVRLGVDAEQRLTALDFQALFDGGAYAGYKPYHTVNLACVSWAGNCYRIPALRIESQIAYTHTVPKGHMRGPGSVQTFFAVESLLDMAARALGADPVQFRARNMLRSGDHGCLGEPWLEVRSEQCLAAALSATGAPFATSTATPLPAAAAPAAPSATAPLPAPTAADRWAHGTGIALFSKVAHGARTEVALAPAPDGTLTVWVPFPDQGAGQFAMARRVVQKELHLPADAICIRQADLHLLSYDPGCSASRVTADGSVALTRASRALRRQLVSAYGLRANAPPLECQSALAALAAARPGDLTRVSIDNGQMPPLISFCVQIARVRVDRGTGQVQVDEIITAADVADILNPTAHLGQIEGGILTGYGEAMLEDLRVEDGQVTAANLGDYKLPSVRDLPRLLVEVVHGGRGAGDQNVKPIGELSNVALIPAIANAVYDAVGVRLDSLPITAEKVFAALHR